MKNMADISELKVPTIKQKISINSNFHLFIQVLIGNWFL